MKEAFSVLRQKQIAPKDWKVEGPGGVTYKVVEHTRENIPDSLKSGKVTFVVEVDGDTTKRQTLVGIVAPDGGETITRDGEELPDADVDGGVAARVSLRGFPPRLRMRGTVILKFRYRAEDGADAADDGDDDTTPPVAEYRFEGNFGQINV